MLKRLNRSCESIDYSRLRRNLSRMSEARLRRIAANDPSLYAEWCNEVFASKRKISADLEFEALLLTKLVECQRRAM